MTKNAVIFVAAAVLAMFSVIMLTAPRAEANSLPVRVLKNVAVVCGATATPITSTGGMSSVCIQNNSATVATIGGSAVTPTTGFAISTATTTSWCGDVTSLWCSSAAGAVTVQAIYGAN